jgi:hypothetical protein
MQQVSSSEHTNTQHFALLQYGSVSCSLQHDPAVLLPQEMPPSHTAHSEFAMLAHTPSHTTSQHVASRAQTAAQHVSSLQFALSCG